VSASSKKRSPRHDPPGEAVKNIAAISWAFLKFAKKNQKKSFPPLLKWKARLILSHCRERLRSGIRFGHAERARKNVGKLPRNEASYRKNCSLEETEYETEAPE
jgi:hypothetical protein